MKTHNQPLHMAPTPCTTCPYRRDVPTGIWAPEEYRKLPPYDQDFASGRAVLSVFHCHQEPEIGKPTVCRGWLSVHANSPAVRIACANGLISVDDMKKIPIEAEPGLYKSGVAACRAGLRGIRRPAKKAREAIRKLRARRGAKMA